MSRRSSADHPAHSDAGFCIKVVSDKASVLIRELTVLKSNPHDKSIHDTRVASRRMRAALEVFKDLFQARAWKTLYRRVRQVTKSLGMIREIEVNLSLLCNLENAGDMADNVCREYLVERLNRKLKAERRSMNTALRSLDPSRLREQTEKLLKSLGPAGTDLGPTTTAQPLRPRNSLKTSQLSYHQPALFEMRQAGSERARRILLDSAFPIVQFRPDRHLRSASEDEIHALRISVKKLRYAMEIFDPVWPGGLKNPISLARKVQDAGGRFHDWCVLRETMDLERQRLKKVGRPHLEFQIGRMLEQLGERTELLKRRISRPLEELQKALRSILPEAPGPGEVRNHKKKAGVP